MSTPHGLNRPLKMTVNSDVNCDSVHSNRRNVLGGMASLLVGIAAGAQTAAAADAPPATVTHRVFMDVRISRQDGTFYVRDDLPDTPENRVFLGRLKIELFGNAAPAAVEQFLRYINVEYNPLQDDPLPSYGRSSFPRLDQATGLLTGGSIPSMSVTSFAGSTALQYGGRVLPAPLWFSPKQETTRLPHSSSGLLTHRILEVLPTFGITTRPATNELDSTHIVFGRVSLDDDESRQFLDLCKDLPTYSMERPKGDPSVVEDVASAVFTGQREVFRGVAKSFGDSRLDKIYEGKLLRRVEVTQVGML